MEAEGDNGEEELSGRGKKVVKGQERASGGRAGEERSQARGRSGDERSLRSDGDEGTISTSRARRGPGKEGCHT